MNNEKGFTYPLSLCLLVFFSFFLLMMNEQFKLEKLFFKETETILLGEYYLQAAITEIEDLCNKEDIPQSGQISFKRGKVTYVRKELSQVLMEITLTLKLENNEQWVAIAQYDKEKQRIVKWLQ